MSFEVPQLEDEFVALITGANSGIGKIAALEIAQAGGRVFLACRSEDRARPVVDEIRAEAGHDRVEFIALDLSSFDSIRACAAQFLAHDLPITLLLNNAGLNGQRGRTTQEGFELAFGVNHLGHFLLTELLRERLIESGPARVVNVASRAHYRADGIDFDALTRPSKWPYGWPEYCVSKLANVLHASELAKHLSDTEVTTYSLHPGVVASNIWRDVPGPIRKLVTRNMLTEAEGARTSLYCATSRDAADESGLFYDSCKPRKPSRPARDEALAKDLWERSMEWAGL